MDNKAVGKHIRRYNSYMGNLNVNYNFLINPWIPLMWSFIFPGFGHMLLGMFVEGYVLIIWEIIVNTSSHLNEAMLYSFTGRFELAKHVLNLNWALLYIAVYIFAAWDSYRSSCDTNKVNILAEKENATIIPYKLTSFSFVYLEKFKPNVVAMWSAFMPGLGQIILHRIPSGFFILGWWMFLCYRSNLPLAGYYTMIGSFDMVFTVLKPQWFLYLPSLYTFAIYDSYFFTVELNKLFKLEQASFFKKEFQNTQFKIPWKNRKLY
ncbi:MAG: hypothetical protein Q8936_19065 [Bacillota bacterium]|nr:hypothetical protein [Bacillota bacterium]